MLRIIVASLLISFSGLSSGTAQRQTPVQPETWKVRRVQAPLEGITAITIKIQDLSDDATRCGLTADALRSATAQPFIDGGLRVLDSRPDRADSVADGQTKKSGPWVSVQISVLAPTPGLCIANTQVDLFEEIAGPLTHKQTHGDAKVIDAPLTVLLLSDGTFAAGMTDGFAQRVLDTARSIAGAFVAKIKRANPSK